MGERGRKSAQSLAIAEVTPVETIERPDAPYDLTDAEAEIWWGVVNRLPGDWFPIETHPLLAQYCRHVVNARRVAQFIENMSNSEGGFDLSEYDRLLRMQERESRCLSSLATKMRISQQSTTNHRANKGNRGTRKPWQS